MKLTATGRHALYLLFLNATWVHGLVVLVLFTYPGADFWSSLSKLPVVIAGGASACLFLAAPVLSLALPKMDWAAWFRRWSLWAVDPEHPSRLSSTLAFCVGVNLLLMGSVLGSEELWLRLCGGPRLWCEPDGPVACERQLAEAPAGALRDRYFLFSERRLVESDGKTVAWMPARRWGSYSSVARPVPVGCDAPKCDVDVKADCGMGSKLLVELRNGTDGSVSLTEFSFVPVAIDSTNVVAFNPKTIPTTPELIIGGSPVGAPVSLLAPSTLVPLEPKAMEMVEVPFRVELKADAMTVAGRVCAKSGLGARCCSSGLIVISQSKHSAVSCKATSLAEARSSVRSDLRSGNTVDGFASRILLSEGDATDERELVAALGDSKNVAVQAGIARTLGSGKLAESEKALAALLDGAHPSVRLAALSSLKTRKGKAFDDAAALRQWARADKPTVASRALQELTQRGDPVAVPICIARLRLSDGGVGCTEEGEIALDCVNAVRRSSDAPESGELKKLLTTCGWDQ